MACPVPCGWRGLRYPSHGGVLDDMSEQLDPESLVGLTVQEASQIAEQHGYVVEVSPVGQRGYTLDLRPGRIRLVSDGTRVTKAWSG
jgi:hypothetical protein